MSKHRLHRACAVATLVMATLGVMAGCGTGQPGVRNWAGTISKELNAPPEAVAAAATRALDDLEMTVLTNQADAVGGRVIARNERDEKVEVSIKAQGEASAVQIRVGMLGDTGFGQTVLDRIERNLGDPAAD